MITTHLTLVDDFPLIVTSFAPADDHERLVRILQKTLKKIARLSRREIVISLLKKGIESFRVDFRGSIEVAGKPVAGVCVDDGDAIAVDWFQVCFFQWPDWAVSELMAHELAHAYLIAADYSIEENTEECACSIEVLWGFNPRRALEFYKRLEREWAGMVSVAVA